MNHNTTNLMKNAISRGRRVLGDITNSVVDDDAKKVAGIKKVNTVAPVTEVVMTTAATNDMIVSSNSADDRTYMQRPFDDIDSRDIDNPLLATEYVNEMYQYFHQTEREFLVNYRYMEKQDYINERMRSILVDWLVEVHLKFKMVPEALFMTISIIDRYLEIKPVRRAKLQLVGVAALLLAAKYEEIYPPEIENIVFITDSAYNKKEILDMELDIAISLEYKFTIPTVHTFLCRYLKAAHADRTMVQLACYLTERMLQEYTMVKFLPSVIAASAVYIARVSLRRHPWSPTLARYTNYDEVDLTECVEEIKHTINNPNNQQKAVSNKYASSRFGGVARMSLLF